MQKDRKSFVLFLDLKDTVDSLSDGQAGKLFKAIFHYQKTGEVNLKGTLNTLFFSIKNQLDRNEKKWEEIKQKRSEAGKRHTGNQYTRAKMEQMEQNGTNGTVNVSVNDNVNVNVSVSEKEKKKEKKDGTNDDFLTPTNNVSTHTPTLDELRSYCFENGMEDFNYEKFYNHYESNGWLNRNGTEIKNWKAKVRYWYKDDEQNGKLIKRQDTSRRLG